MCGKLPCLPEESVRCGIFKGRIMFNFRPYVPGFNVKPPADAEVPGFRMNADGSVRTVTKNIDVNTVMPALGSIAGGEVVPGNF